VTYCKSLLLKNDLFRDEKGKNFLSNLLECLAVTSNSKTDQHIRCAPIDLDENLAYSEEPSSGVKLVTVI